MSLPRSIFLSHGAPNWVLRPGRLGQLLNTERERWNPLPKAVLVLSPHQPTPGLSLGAAARPVTCHDFQGFEPELRQLSYPAPGAPGLAAALAAGLRSQGWEIELDPDRGLDHGVWVPLRLLFPAATLPVLPLSLAPKLDAAALLALGAALRQLAGPELLIIGSGGLTHNLAALRWQDPRGLAVVEDFRTRLAADLAAGRPLLERDWTGVEQVHPQPDHLLPLFFAAGAGQGRPRRLDGGVEHGALAMEAYVWDD